MTSPTLSTPSPSTPGPAAAEVSPLAVAMSGGLDSSVVAWLMAREARQAAETEGSGAPGPGAPGPGPAVVGLSMLLWDHSDREVSGRCCGALDLGDARRVAQQAGIPHYTLRMDEEFREKVVDPFVTDYLEGRTPSPCVACNTSIKFDALLARARRFGAERVATGHYARILEGPHGPELHAAVDAAKDQSYFLFELTREQLAASLFPLGELAKDQVRQLAREAGLVVAEKAESMEICFVAGTVQEFVEDRLAEAPERYGEAGRRMGERRGDGSAEAAGAQILTEEGDELGRGAPYYRYTVGQRRGLGVAAGERLYVIGVEPEENRVRVGPVERLMAPGLVGRGLHWITPEVLEEAGDGTGLEATVKIRSRHPGAKARIEPLPASEGEARVRILFDEPQRGITPGQAAVFYRGSQVLGGCWIEDRLD